MYSAVTYPDLDKAKRRTIWKSFLALAGVGIEGEKLSNGDVPHIVEEGSKDDKIPEIKSYVSSKYLDRLAAKTGFNGTFSSAAGLDETMLTHFLSQVVPSRTPFVPLKLSP